MNLSKLFPLGRWQQLSFRQRLTWGVTALHVLLMSALVLDLLYRQHDFLHQQGLRHANSLATTLAVSSASWVMANDLAGLQEVTRSVAEPLEVRYVMLLDTELRVLAHSDPQWVGLYAVDEASLKLREQPSGLVSIMRSHELEDVAAPVMAGHKQIGWARVGLGQELVMQSQVRSFFQGLLYLLAGSLIAYVFARLVTRRLISGLSRVTKGFARVSAGERGMRIPFDHRDEVGVLAQGFNRMMADLESNEDKLQTLAATDFLTGLPNRRSFLERLEVEQARQKRGSNTPVALLMLDLDHFKKVNDNYGHIAGDAVLRHVASCMQASLRVGDIAGRLGGEEFVMLLANADQSSARQVAERLRQTIAEHPLDWEDQSIAVTVSIGLTLLHPDDELPETVLNRADLALYCAKGAGRNRVEEQL